MKPLTLTMSAFGPYEKETTIDFTKFDNSLFLITGRTGSGKTTIFDGIMYSLYGEVSGGERKAPEMRTKFVNEKTVTRLILEFEHDGDRYSVERTIRYNSKADATLNCPDGTVIEGLKNVNAFIPSLIGITPEQFRGVVMLAQGKFRELLTAKSDERADILRKIFSTDIYKLFQNRLKEKVNEINSKNQKEVSKIDTMIHTLSCPEDMTELSAFLENPAITSDSMNILFSEIALLEKEDRERVESLEKEIKKGIIESNEITGNLAKAQDTNKKLETLQKEQEEYSSLLQQEKYYLSIEEQTKTARKAVKVSSAENGWQKACNDVLSFNRTVEEKTRFVQENKPQVELLSKKVDELSKNPEQELLQKEKGTLELALPQYDNLEKTNAELTAEQKHQKDTLFRIEEIDKAIAVLQDTIRTKEETLKTLERVELDLQEKNTVLESTESKTKKINEIEEMLNNLQKQKKVAEAAKKESDAARKTYDSLLSIYQKMQNTLWDNQAGVLADKLREGEACPVCGSTVHPHPAPLLESAPTEDEVKDALKQVENARKTADTSVAKAEREDADYKSRKEYLLKSVKEQFEDTIDLSGDILSIAPALNSRKNSLEKERENLLTSIRELKEKSDLRTELMKLIPELQEEEKQKKLLQDEESKSLQKSKEIISGLTTKIETIKHGLKYTSRKEAELHLKELNQKIAALSENLNQARKMLDTLKSEVDQASGARDEAAEKLKTAKIEEKKEHEMYLQALSENGFTTEEAYHTARNNIETLEEDEKKVAKYRQERDQKRGSLDASERDTRGLSPVDITQLTEKDREVRKKLDSLRIQQGELHHRIQDNTKNMNRIKDAWISLEKVMDEQNALIDLSSIANGEISGNKLDLERYIMAAFFDDVLANANRKLNGMTAGRYQLIRADDGDKRKTAGLDLAIIDRYSMGITRATQTLSGGESFMAALSLALGLSDAIQQSAGGISINALFVDEGFDSLDTDTLQEVLKVLQGLTTGNRLVGIISHVESLKEQIEKKIVVTKLGDGKSVLKIEG